MGKSKNIVGCLGLGLSGLVGGVLCVFADLGLKNTSSATLTIARNLQEIFKTSDSMHSILITAFIILALAVSMCFIFPINSKEKAFFRGASVLAIAMTVVPINEPGSLKTGPNSVEVNVIVQASDARSITEIVVELKNAQTKAIVARSKFNGGQFTFYQDAGNYLIYFQVHGYKIESRELNLIEGKPPQTLHITLTPTGVPIFLQRILK